MGTVSEAVENLEGAADEIVVIVGPPQWDLEASMLRSIIQAFKLGEKELRMYTAFVILWCERINGDQTCQIGMFDLKKLLGIGFQREASFREIRKRLERVNLLKVERNSLPQHRGGVRNTYTLVLSPNMPNRHAVRDLYKGIDKKNNNILEQESVTKNILNGVDDWTPRPAQAKKTSRGDIGADVETWNGSHRLNYFLEKYAGIHNTQYILTAGRGVHERRLSDLPAPNEVYRDFIDWLAKKKDLRSINFLPEQLNAYLRDNFVSPSKRLENGIRGEFYKVQTSTGELAVVHQYAGHAVKNAQMLALDAIEAGLITVETVVEWDLCPPNVLARMGLTK